VKSIFLTGASGFVGHHLLSRLCFEPVAQIFCLTRRPLAVTPQLGHDNVRFLHGSLSDVAVYRDFLAQCDCVIHLAALTGKAPPAEYFRSNVEGTRILLETCRSAGVKKFLFVSSIAAGFSEKQRYYYAQSKEQAEQLVRQSGLRHTILRPTMIFGPASPVQAGLERLAALPVVPVFGDGRTPVQPIHVGDVAEFIMSIVAAERFAGETLEIGGPQALSIEDLLRRMRIHRTGKDALTLHLPLSLLIPALTALEVLAYRFLPITVGQLATFRNSGTIQPNSLWQQHAPQLRSLDSMLTRQPAAGAEIAPLARECNVFARFLSGPMPSPYVLEKYLHAHARSAAFTDATRFDRALLAFARRGPFWTRLTDSFACLFARRSVFRRKLILLAAILESVPPEQGFLDAVRFANPFALALVLAAKGLAFAACLLLSVLLFLPLRIALGPCGELGGESH